MIDIWATVSLGGVLDGRNCGERAMRVNEERAMSRAINRLSAAIE